MKPTMIATEPRLSERHRWIAERIRGSEKFLNDAHWTRPVGVADTVQFCR